MCGRITLTADLNQIKQHFNLIQANAVLIPRYNIAPQQKIIIIKNNTLNFATWGVKLFNLNKIIINARLETVLTKKCFVWSFKQRRCLIVASGFFEWKSTNRTKTPFYIQSSKKEILAFGGFLINDHCIILTTTVDPTKKIHAIHDRMPLIIHKKYYNLWLNDKAPLDQLINSSLQIEPDNLLAYPVSLNINNPKFDNIACIQAVH